jgi:hypothetical protein
MDEQPINQDQTVTLKLPKANMQLIVLILIIIIAAFQTFQLITLKGQATIVPVGTTTQAPASAPAGLDMVGGC